MSSVAQLPNAEVVALFSDSPKRGELPHTIIVGKSQLREFFAWAATYLGHWSPLTARVRVMRRIDVSSAVFDSVSKRYLSLDMSRALACVIIGEALCEWNLAGEKSSPTLLSLRSTFSYAAVESLKREQTDAESLFDAWERTQRLLRLSPRRIERKQFLNVWQPLLDSRVDDPIARERHGQLGVVLPDLIRSQRMPSIPGIDSKSLFDRTDFGGGGRRREDAVVELEEWLSHRGLDQPAGKFYTACLAARLSPGPLTHFDVIAKMTSSDPEVLLWYCFVSGLVASEPSGQLIERMLFKLLGECEEESSDQCGDISLDELEVLMQSDGHLPPWIGIGGGYVKVELKMGVCSYFRLRDRSNGAGSTGPSRPDPASDKQVFDDLLEQLRVLYVRKNTPPQKKRRKR